MRVLMLLVLGATHDPRPLPEAVTVDAHVTFFFWWWERPLSLYTSLGIADLTKQVIL